MSRPRRRIQARTCATSEWNWKGPGLMAGRAVQSTSERFALRVVRIGAYDDVVDPFTQRLVPGLPTFTARMHGVSDVPR